MSKVTFAATQMACVEDSKTNIDLAEALVREAAGYGAQVILLQELFETPYFCKDIDSKHLELAHDGAANALIARFQDVARELSVVLPISFFERANNAYFNSIGIVDADGEITHSLDLFKRISWKATGLVKRLHLFCGTRGHLKQQFWSINNHVRIPSRLRHACWKLTQQQTGE